mgnify:CR=1 FL=1
MIKLEKLSVMNLENAVRGARNPMNSWDKSDSYYDENGKNSLFKGKNFIDAIKLVVPPFELIEKLNLSAIIEQMTFNTKEIFILEELQSTILSQLSSR